VAQDHITLERFADYWDKDRIHIDKVIYRPIQDSTVRLANLQSGNLDIIERLLATDIATVLGDPKLKLVTRVSLGYTGLTINLANTDKAKNPLGLNAKGASINNQVTWSVGSAVRSCSSSHHERCGG
jgi:peptide/nickel transport system substrate-binding protein